MADNGKSEGNNVVITLLVSFGTILYATYSYFQVRAIDNNFYVSSVGVISVLLISSLFLIAYIIVKGYSMEAKERKDNFGKNCVRYSFFSFLGRSDSIIVYRIHILFIYHFARLE